MKKAILSIALVAVAFFGIKAIVNTLTNEPASGTVIDN